MDLSVAKICQEHDCQLSQQLAVELLGPEVKLVLGVLKSRLGYLYTHLWDGNLLAGFSSVAHWENEKNADML